MSEVSLYWLCFDSDGAGWRRPPSIRSGRVARRVLATSTLRGGYGLVQSDFPRWREVVVFAN